MLSLGKNALNFSPFLPKVKIESYSSKVLSFGYYIELCSYLPLIISISGYFKIKGFVN